MAAVAPAPPKRRSRWQQTFTALRHPNYRLWFFGQTVSLFGTWMQSTAQGYLIFQLTHSPAFLGYVSFASGVPSWLFTLYGGVVADRMPRRTLLLITQTAMMLLAFILAALTFSHWVQPWHILVLAFCLGTANAFDAPARQAFVLEMVEREDLTNAIALNATMFNMGTALGPAMAGLTYAAFGPGWCFLLNALSFIAVIGALALMRLKPFVMPARRASAWSDLREALRYIAGEPIIRVLIGMVAVTSLFGFSFVTLFPAWAVTVLGGDARTNGWLQSARGVGALISALGIASLSHFQFKGKLLTVGMFLLPLTMLVFAAMRWLPLALVVLVGVGASITLFMNLANALVQTQVTDELRGRVMGVYTLVFMGLMPVGGLLAGEIAERIGEPLTVTLSAGVLLACAALVWLFIPRVRALP